MNKPQATNGIICLSDDCIYNQASDPGCCGLRHVCLHKGTCRYYNPGDPSTLDRTDLPGKSYEDFICQSDSELKTKETV